jgi:nitronate monooxygenase
MNRNAVLWVVAVVVGVLIGVSIMTPSPDSEPPTLPGTHVDTAQAPVNGPANRGIVPVWITSYGDPTPLVGRAHASGATVFHDVINLRHARKAKAAGVDAIIGVSSGAGGQAGRITPMALGPWLRRELDMPVIAVGSISTGSQVAAALGADLAYMGTRFIASKECRASERYKQLVVDAGPEDIVYTDEISGVHANFLRSTLPAERPDSPLDAKRWRDIWSAGHGVAQIDQVKSIEDIVEDLVREYHDTVSRLGG